MTQAKVRFAVTGLNHDHIYGQTSSMLDAGAEAVCFYAPEDDLVAQFAAAYPQIPRVNTLEKILEDDSIQLVLNAGIPVERAPMGIKVMQHGKDYMVDKPGLTTLEQLSELRQVQAETGQIYSVCYSVFGAEPPPKRMSSSNLVPLAKSSKRSAWGHINAICLPVPIGSSSKSNTGAS